MSHNDSIRAERIMRTLNGETWEHSADLIDAEPTKQLAIGLLEYLNGGNRSKAIALYWLGRIWKSADDDETRNFLPALLDDAAYMTDRNDT